jgi:hypothetical protein
MKIKIKANKMIVVYFENISEHENGYVKLVCFTDTNLQRLVKINEIQCRTSKSEKY